ncbi:MAG: 4-oxalocrotonate tautomerase DmpI [Bacillota bacterium]
MPHIVFDGPKLSREQKAELVRRFTEISSAVTGIAAQAFVVVIKENSPENVGVGGQLVADRPKS